MTKPEEHFHLPDNCTETVDVVDWWLRENEEWEKDPPIVFGGRETSSFEEDVDKQKSALANRILSFLQKALDEPAISFPALFSDTEIQRKALERLEAKEGVDRKLLALFHRYREKTLARQKQIRENVEAAYAFFGESPEATSLHGLDILHGTSRELSIRYEGLRNRTKDSHQSKVLNDEIKRLFLKEIAKVCEDTVGEERIQRLEKSFSVSPVAEFNLLQDELLQSDIASYTESKTHYDKAIDDALEAEGTELERIEAVAYVKNLVEHSHVGRPFQISVLERCQREVTRLTDEYLADKERIQRVRAIQNVFRRAPNARGFLKGMCEQVLSEELLLIISEAVGVDKITRIQRLEYETRWESPEKSFWSNLEEQVALELIDSVKGTSNDKLRMTEMLADDVRHRNTKNMVSSKIQELLGQIFADDLEKKENSNSLTAVFEVGEALKSRYTLFPLSKKSLNRVERSQVAKVIEIKALEYSAPTFFQQVDAIRLAILEIEVKDEDQKQVLEKAECQLVMDLFLAHTTDMHDKHATGVAAEMLRGFVREGTRVESAVKQKADYEAILRKEEEKQQREKEANKPPIDFSF